MSLYNDLEYDNHSMTTSKIEDLIFVLGIEMPDAYETASEMLFHVMCEATRMYVQSIVASPPAGGVTLGELMAAKGLMEDPSKVVDPHQIFLANAIVTLGAVFENLEPEAPPSVSTDSN